tara:strand:+ start:1951 stop:2076 length:126 start_codon:yes stop_codon:yes gene_type:complete
VGKNRIFKWCNTVSEIVISGIAIIVMVGGIAYMLKGSKWDE